MLPVFITSNQIPLHVHAVFCQLHVHCIHLARGMMRMPIPSNYIIILCTYPGAYSVERHLNLNGRDTSLIIMDLFSSGA